MNQMLNMQKLLSEQQAAIEASVDTTVEAKAMETKAHITSKITETKAHVTTKSTSVKALVSTENDETQAALGQLTTVNGQIDTNVQAVNAHVSTEAERVLASLGTESYPVYICKSQGSHSYQNIHESFGGYPVQNLNAWPGFVGGVHKYTSAQSSYTAAQVTGSGFVSTIRLRNSAMGTVVIHLTIDGKKSTVTIVNQSNYGMVFLNWIEANSATNSKLRPIWRLQADLGYSAGVPFKESLKVEIDYTNAGATRTAVTYDNYSFVQYSLNNAPVGGVEVVTI